MKLNPLLQLLRRELWQTDEDCNLQWSQVNALLITAEDQAVEGLIIHALLKSGVLQGHEDEYYDAIGVIAQIQQENELVNKQLDAFETMMAEVPHVVVKGQMVARYYPDGSLRQSGDIDFFCEPGYYQRAKALLSSVQAIEWQESDSYKHEVFVWNEVLFEMHASLMTFFARSHQRYWDNNVEPHVAEATEEVVYVFAHLFHHFIVGGVGLKQFCDLAMTIHHYRDELDVERLQSHLEALGLLAAFRAVGWVLVNALGLPEDEFPFKISAINARRGTAILEDVLKMGCFGANVREQGKTGIWLSLETARIVTRQVFRYYQTAPLELTCILPKMAVLNVKKYCFKLRRNRSIAALTRKAVLKKS